MPIPSDSLLPDAPPPKGCTTFSSSATVKEKVLEACGNILYSNYNPKPPPWAYGCIVAHIHSNFKNCHNLYCSTYNKNTETEAEDPT